MTALAPRPRQRNAPCRSLQAMSVARVEPCACGGLVVAEADTPESIRTAVEIHNTSLLHLAWRERSEFDWVRFGPIAWPEFLLGDAS